MVSVAGWRRFRGLGVVLLALVAYLPTWESRFVCDDHVLVEPWIHDGATPVGSVLGQGLFGEDARGRSRGVFHRPFVSASYRLDAALFGDRPALHHAHNVVVHALVAWLLLQLLASFAPLAGLAFPAAILFAAHPLLSESVAVVTNRTDLWAAAWSLAALLAASRQRLVLAVAASLLGFLSKETAAVTFLLLPIVACAGGVSARRAGIASGIGLLLVVAAFWFRRSVLGIVAETEVWTGTGTLTERALTFVAAIGAYATKLVLPTGLSILHDFPLVRSIGEPRFLASLLGLAAVFTVGIREARRGRPAILVGTLVFVLFLVPVSNLVPFPFAPVELEYPFFERYAYLPAMGGVLVLAALLRAAIGTHAVPAVALVLALPGGYLAGRHARELGDDVTLLESCAARYSKPATPLAYAGYAHYLAGDLDTALSTFDRALAADPGHEEATLGRSMVEADRAQAQLRTAELWRTEGRTRDAEVLHERAIAALRSVRGRLEALALVVEDHAPVQELLGTVCALAGDLDAGLAAYARALELEGASEGLPGNVEHLLTLIYSQPEAADPDAAFARWGFLRDTVRALRRFPECDTRLQRFEEAAVQEVLRRSRGR